MKACIFDIKRFAIHDGPGIRVTVFFKGCPMNCSWCHNPEGIGEGIESYQEEKDFDGILLKKEVRVGRLVSIDELLTEIQKDRIFMDESGGGVTLSGGEPLLQHEFVGKMLEELRNLGIHSCIDTSGYLPRLIMKEIAEKTDLILYDLKLMDDNQHIYYTGVSNKNILKNLEILNDCATGVIIRFPLIPGINDHAKQLDDIIAFLKPLNRIRKVDVLPFHNFARNKYLRFCKPCQTEGIQVPSDEQVEVVRSAFFAAGFNRSN